MAETTEIRSLNPQKKMAETMAETTGIRRLQRKVNESDKEIGRQKEIKQELNKEIGRQKEIKQTKEKLIHNDIAEKKRRMKIKEEPKRTQYRRWQLQGLPYIDLRLPWTEGIPLEIETVQPEKTTRCVIQNMNNCTTKQELEQEFAQYGPIQKTRIIHNENKRTIHYATITFVSSRDAATAAKCINGTSIHLRLLSVQNTDDVPKKENRQVVTETTPQVIKVHTDEWRDGFKYKTERLEELKDQLKMARAISDGPRKQSQPRSPETPRSSSYSPSISDQEESTTLDSMPKWVVTIEQPKGKDKEKTLAITETNKEKLDIKYHKHHKCVKAAAMAAAAKKAKRDDNIIQKEATTNKLVIERQGKGSETPMPSENEAEPLPVLRESIQELDMTNDKSKSKINGNKQAHVESNVQDTTTKKGKLPQNFQYYRIPKKATITKTDENRSIKTSGARTSTEPDSKRARYNTNKDQEADSDILEIKTNSQDRQIVVAEEQTSIKSKKHQPDKQKQKKKGKTQEGKNQLDVDVDKEKKKPQYLKHDNITRTTKVGEEITQRWKLGNDSRFKNKEGVWRSSETWSFITKGQNKMYIKNSEGKVLAAQRDGKVIQEFVIEGRNEQLWKKGVPNKKGYFTLRNYGWPFGMPKYLTAISEKSLKIKNLAETAIQWRMAPTNQQNVQGAVEENNRKKRTGEIVDPKLRLQQQKRSHSRYRSINSQKRLQQTKPNANHQNVSNSSVYKEKVDQPTYHTLETPVQQPQSSKLVAKSARHNQVSITLPSARE